GQNFTSDKDLYTDSR
nr:RecName: Full=Peroxidase 9 [Daucus carota]